MVCSVIPRLDISEFNDSKKGRVKVRSLRSDSFSTVPLRKSLERIHLSVAPPHS